MKQKHWNEISQSVSSVVELIEAVPGVISVHGQLADTLAVIVVLVDSDESRRAIRDLECQIYDGSDTPPIDIRVRRVDDAEITAQQTALDTAYGRLGSRS